MMGSRSPVDAMERITPLLSIQALRAVAAALVVIYHLINAESVYGGGITVLGGPAHFGFAGVDVFFVISGFIMATVTAGQFGSRARALDFLGKRAVRILPLYWICTAVIAAMVMLRPGSLDPALADRSLVHSLLLIPQEGGPLLVVGWTLTYELLFYAATALALAFGSRRHVPWLLLGWAASLLALQAVPAQGPIVALLTSPLSIEFIAGAAVGLYWRKLPTALAWPAMLLALAWMATAAMVLIDVPGHGQTDGVRVIAFGLPAALLVAGVARLEHAGRVRVPRLAVILGDASYSLYLTHLFVMSIMGRLWSALGAHGTIGSNVGFLVATFCACCVAAVIVHRVLERPLMTMGNALWDWLAKAWNIRRPATATRSHVAN